jgi:hypothetical protein
MGELVGFLSSTAGFNTAILEHQLAQTLASWQKTWATFCTSIQLSPSGCELQRKADGDFVFECPRSMCQGGDERKGRN